MRKVRRTRSGTRRPGKGRTVTTRWTDGRTRLQVVSPLAAEVNLAKVASAARSHAGFAGSVCRVAAVRSSREEEEWGKREAEKIKAKPPVKNPSASSPLRRFHSRRTSDTKQPPCPGESRANPGRSSVSVMPLLFTLSLCFWRVFKVFAEPPTVSKSSALFPELTVLKHEGNNNVLSWTSHY